MPAEPHNAAGLRVQFKSISGRGKTPAKVDWAPWMASSGAGALRRLVLHAGVAASALLPAAEAVAAP